MTTSKQAVQMGNQIELEPVEQEVVCSCLHCGQEFIARVLVIAYRMQRERLGVIRPECLGPDGQALFNEEVEKRLEELAREKSAPVVVKPLRPRRKAAPAQVSLFAVEHEHEEHA